MFGTYTKIGAVEESSYGVTPSSALQLINASSIKMPQNKKRGRPDVLTGTPRRLPGRVLQKSGAGLTIPMPGQYENALLFQEGLLANSRGTLVTVTGTDITFTEDTTDKIESAANAFTDVLTGDMLYVTGAGAGSNAGKWVGPVVKVDAGELTVPDGQIVDQASGGSVTLRTRRLIDGTTAKSYSVEYQLIQLTTMFRNAIAQRVAAGKFGWKQGEWMTEEYTLTGKVPVKASATIGTGSATAAKTTDFLNSVDDLRQLFFGGYGTSLNAITIASFDLMIDRVVELVYGLGNVGPSKAEVGAIDATLDIQALMDDNTKDLIDASDADETLFGFLANDDPQGNHLCFVLPAMKVDVDDVPVEKADSLVNIQAKFTSHDPARDTDSPLGTSIPYQVGMFFCPA